MSLRELPRGRSVSRRAIVMSKYRYVPIAGLLVCAIVLSVGGFFVRRHLATAPPPAPSLANAAPVTGAPSTGGFALECRTPVTPPAQQPWLGGQAAKAEAVWQAHAADRAKDYVVGTNGYVDWNDGVDLNVSQAIGRRVLSEAEANAWANYIASVQKKLAAMGIPFYVLVGPQKWQV